MSDYSFIPSEADTILFSVYAVLRDSGYSEPIVADTDTYMAAAPISQKLPGLLCIKRKQETILCRNLVPKWQTATGCHANSGFYNKGKLSVNDKVAKSAGSSQSVEIPSTLKRKQLRSCLSSLALLSMGTR